MAQLIQYNFDPRSNKEAYKAGNITAIPFRYSDIGVMATVIQALTTAGYLNPEDENDWAHVRSAMSIPNRAMTPADKTKIKKLSEPKPTGSTSRVKIKKGAKEA